MKSKYLHQKHRPPPKLSTSSGDRKFEYVYGAGLPLRQAGKYSAQLITGNPAIDEMRHYVGGMEFKNGVLEAYNFGDGRVVFHDSVPTLRFQYRLADHLGNTVVFFEDKNNNGCITTEGEATSQADLEIIQRLLYYPFGMALEGLGAWGAQPWQQYRYNGKERDTLTGWYDYGARWYLSDIGRFPSVDPLADWAPEWTPYRYGFNNPISFIDPDGLFESKTAARDYAKDKKIKLGLFSGNRIEKHDDGFAITSIVHTGGHTTDGGTTFITDLGGELGVVHGVTITPNDVVGETNHLLTYEHHHRDGSTEVFDRPMLGGPGGGAVRGGISLLGHAGKNIYAASAGSKLLTHGSKALHKHHVLPQKFRKWFASRGINNIDDYTIQISQQGHLKGVHGKGLGNLPGKWNQNWAEFINSNPNATPSQIFHQAESLLRRYGLEHLPYIPY